MTSGEFLFTGLVLLAFWKFKFGVKFLWAVFIWRGSVNLLDFEKLFQIIKNLHVRIYVKWKKINKLLKNNFHVKYNNIKLLFPKQTDKPKIWEFSVLSNESRRMFAIKSYASNAFNLSIKNNTLESFELYIYKIYC